ncbi:MAG: GGDEF domain-containing protein [Rhizobiaceae bacterium]|nr:GGDEF domain-containing protein [Rhizobiaceae bacterium]
MTSSLTLPLPLADDDERLAVLRSYAIMDSDPSEALDALVKSACHLFDVPIGMVALLDDRRQWFKSVSGLSLTETPLDGSFCARTIRGGDLLVVEDAATDPRFADSRYVTGEPRIRFYAGAPLTVRPGIALGSFCVIDTRPRRITADERALLQHLATVAMALIESHKLSVDSIALAEKAEQRARELRLRERQFKQTEELAEVGGWEVDLATNLITSSDEVYRIWEVPVGTPMKVEDAFALFPDDERRRIEERFFRLIEHGERYDENFRIHSKSGRPKWVRAVGDVELVDGIPRRLFGILQDISKRHAAEAELWHAANHDALTGLANRAHFIKRITHLFERRAAEADAGAGLLMIDVDRMKEINDTLGHAAGDLLLCAVGERILKAAADDALVARIGGDEFVLMLREGVTAERLARMSADIIAAMVEPLSFGAETILPRVSIGGAVAVPGDTAETLRQKADLALYESKDRGRGGYAEFREAMRDGILKRVATLRSVDEALGADRLVPYYQPIVRLDTAEIVGLEALARMRMPDGRIVAAGAFQEALREPRIAHRLTTSMLGAVARDLRMWLDRGFPCDHVGINVTTADFTAGDLRSRIHDCFGALGVPLRHIVIEVTETVFLGGNESAVLRDVEELRRDGIVIALDDFGTGFASLTHLRSLPVNLIKIDKSFVQGMMEDRTSGSIVEALIDLARKLGLKIVAEGIETVVQAEQLREMRCRLGQGYFYARPADAATTYEMLRNFGQHRAKLHARREDRSLMAG